MAVARTSTVIRACGHPITLDLEPNTAESQVKAALRSYCSGDYNDPAFTACDDIVDGIGRRHEFRHVPHALSAAEASGFRRQGEPSRYYHVHTDTQCTLVLDADSMKYAPGYAVPYDAPTMSGTDAKRHMKALTRDGFAFRLETALTWTRVAYDAITNSYTAERQIEPEPVPAETVLECDRRGELLEPVIERDLGHSVLGQAAAVVNAIPEPAPVEWVENAGDTPATPHECHTRSHTDGGWRKRGFTLKPDATSFERDGWTLYCRHQVIAAGSPAAATAERVGAGA